MSETLETQGVRDVRRADPPPALVVAWSVHDPGRVGERVELRGHVTTWGRESELVRLRPSGVEGRPPLDDPFVSREQLRIEAAGSELTITNVGRRESTLDGLPFRQATVAAGSRLAIRGRVLFYVVSNPPFPNTVAPSHPFGAPDEDGIVGESGAMWRLRESVGLVASRSRHILLLGESGSGKELVARALHRRSERSRGPFVPRNAATLPEGLVDAEMFGNLRNYPNPGMPARPGLVGLADGGTLFLDEIGELPEALQAHLLRLLDEGEYQSLGDSHVRRSDLRVVAATNRALDSLKHDLAARFVLRLEVPPLRDRREDVGLLLRYLATGLARSEPDLAPRLLGERGQPNVDLDFVEQLLAHPLPTNVRELERWLWGAVMAASPGEPLQPPDVTSESAAPRRRYDEVTKEELVAALDRVGGVRARAWKELGLKDRYVLRRLMRKFGIE